jgi:alkylation response protein AidB-like acyl-CoA dehydrogenase
MFAFSLLSLTSDEQKEKWLPKLLNFEIFGTYAQTELGTRLNEKYLLI